MAAEHPEIPTLSQLFLNKLRTAVLDSPETPLLQLFPHLEEELSQLEPDALKPLIDTLRFAANPDAQEVLTHIASPVTEKIIHEVQKADGQLQTSSNPALEDQIRDLSGLLGDFIHTLDLLEVNGFSHTQLRSLFSLMDSPIPALRSQALQLAPTFMRLDRREPLPEGEKPLDELVRDKIILFYTDSAHKDPIAAKIIVQSLVSEASLDLKSLFVNELGAIDPSETRTVENAFAVAANILGLEETILFLVHQMKESQDSVNFQANAAHILSIFTQFDAKLLEAADLYEGPLDINAWPAENDERKRFDINLLLKTFQNENHLLDIACGTGPHIQELIKAGKVMGGVDIAPRNVERARAANPEADIQLASWWNLPFPDHSFEGGYSIDRSAGHNFTVAQWIAFLSEAHRVVAGPLLVDGPNAEMGTADARRTEYAEKATALGIRHFEEGAYVGRALDGVYTFRTALSDEQMKAIAVLAGYEAEEIARQKYTDHTGKPNENIFWKLTPKEFTMEDKLKAVPQAYTGFQPLF